MGLEAGVLLLSPSFHGQSKKLGWSLHWYAKDKKRGSPEATLEGTHHSQQENTVDGSL